MKPNKPFDYESSKREALLITSSTDGINAKIISNPVATSIYTPEYVRGKNYVELSVPGGYVTRSDLNDVVGLVLDDKISNVFVIIQQNSGFINALSRYIKNPDEPNPRYEKRLKDAIRAFARASMSAEEVKGLSKKGLAYSLASAAASNIVDGINAASAKLSKEENSQKQIRVLDKVQVATYISSGRDLEPVIELVSTKTAKTLSPKQRRATLGF